MMNLLRLLRRLNPSCRDAAELVSRRMDDERLPAADRFGLAAHLAGCSDCRRFERQLRLLRRLARGAWRPSDRAEVDLGHRWAAARQRIRERLTSGPSERRV